MNKKMQDDQLFIKEMVNVGVTAKLASPKYHISTILQSSSTETEATYSHSKYKKFLNENTGSDNSKKLYQLKAIDEHGLQKVTPSKIEFLLYRKSQRHPRTRLSSGKSIRTKKSHSSMKRHLESESKSEILKPLPAAETSFVGKLKKSVRNLKTSQPEKNNQNSSHTCFVDIYQFDHGCAEYLRTTDGSQQIISEIVAQRATDYATRFWAEFFGSLHIGVAFFLTFLIQTYRFILYSVVKSVVVGFLQMTSDYGIKPLLTVVFNGFLQPGLIFVHNILSSIRDLLKPVSETMTHFFKPIEGLLRSMRLIVIRVSGEKGVVKNV